MKLIPFSILSLSLIGCNGNEEFYKKLGEANKIETGLRYQIDSLSQRLDSLITSVQIDESMNSSEFDNSVDLTQSQLQTIRSPFLVSINNLKQNLTGVLITGNIVNSSNVSYKSADFKIKIGNQTQEIFINDIPKGGTGYFTVYVPDVPVDKSKYATINYISATILYSR